MSILVLEVVLTSEFCSFFLLQILNCSLHLPRISEEDYVNAMKEEINKVVKLQEELDIDVLVHGEPEVSFQ